MHKVRAQLSAERDHAASRTKDSRPGHPPRSPHCAGLSRAAFRRPEGLSGERPRPSESSVSSRKRADPIEPCARREEQSSRPIRRKTARGGAAPARTRRRIRTLYQGGAHLHPTHPYRGRADRAARAVRPGAALGPLPGAAGGGTGSSGLCTVARRVALGAVTAALGLPPRGPQQVSQDEDQPMHRLRPLPGKVGSCYLIQSDRRTLVWLSFGELASYRRLPQTLGVNRVLQYSSQAHRHVLRPQDRGSSRRATCIVADFCRTATRDFLSG